MAETRRGLVLVPVTRSVAGFLCSSMGGLAFSNSPAVSWLWGNSPVDFRTSTLLDFPAFTVFATNYPAYKLFMLVISIAIFVGLFVMLTHTRIGLWAGLECGLEILVR